MHLDPLRVKELYEKYAFILYRRCLSILCSEDDARDAMQEVFLKFAEHVDRIEQKAVITWLYRTSANYCFNILRSRKKFLEGIEPDTLTGRADDGGEDTRLFIKELLGTGDRRVREAAYFTYIERLDQEEIRAVTGQSPATIRRNLAKFREKAKRLIESGRYDG